MRFYSIGFREAHSLRIDQLMKLFKMIQNISAEERLDLMGIQDWTHIKREKRKTTWDKIKRVARLPFMSEVSVGPKLDGKQIARLFNG